MARASSWLRAASRSRTIHGHDMRSAENIGPACANHAGRLGSFPRAFMRRDLAVEASEGLSEFDPTLSVRSGRPSRSYDGYVSRGCSALGLILPMLAGTGMALLFFSAILCGSSPRDRVLSPSAPGAPTHRTPTCLSTRSLSQLYRERGGHRAIARALEELDYPAPSSTHQNRRRDR